MQRARIETKIAMDQVLLVDADPGVRASFARTLGRAGFAARVAPSGEDGLALLDADPGSYAVVLADALMPGLDGVSFLREVAAVAPWTTRILVSAELDLPALVRAVNTGSIFQVITKPWVTEELVPLLRRAKDRAHLSRQNARLLAELREQNRELERLNAELDRRVLDRTSALLDGLISALDLREGSSRWRSRRVAAYTRRLAQLLCLDEPEIQVCEWAALLHDVGKLGISDAILTKPGPLDEEEWRVMRTHPQMGHALLAGIDFLQEPAEIVLQHHERWDGSGYPRGLRGEEIHLGARIFAVADALDAITIHRPHRAARGWRWARAELARGAGTQFDPQVVAAYMGVADEDWQALSRRFALALVAPPDA